VVPWQPLGVRPRPHRGPPQRLFAADRRVVVKAGAVRHRGRAFGSAPPSAHVAYLERDGVTRDGEKGRMLGAAKDRTDAMAFAGRGLNNRHHFRFIVTPEDAAEMTDLKAFTRTWSARWRAISAPGWTGLASPIGTPTTRMCICWVRGVADDGSDLVISRDYISHGLRSRGTDRVSAELGPRSEHEIRSSRAGGGSRALDAPRRGDPDGGR
jgi:type IV secretory pathway VirD2 relaxase